MQSFVVRLALVYSGLFAAMGVQLPFLPVWFAAKGLDSASIGLIFALATAVRLVIVPLATHTTDRFQKLNFAILLAALTATLLFGALAFTETPLALFLLFPLAATAASTIVPLVETYAVKGLERRGLAYGPVRLWASLAFIGGSLAAGAAIGLVSAAGIIWMIVAAYATCCLLAPLLHPLALVEPTAPIEAQPKASDGVTLFVLAIASASFTQASHAFYYGFSALEWGAQGILAWQVGLLWGVGVAAEIALFAVSGRFPRWLGPAQLLAVGACGGFVRWSAMAFDPPLAVVVPLQCLHALSFGATHLGAVLLVARAAPSGLAATAQGALSTAIGVAMALALAASGNLRAGFGGAAYVAMAALAAFGLLCAIVAIRISPKAPERAPA
jgi:MFS transporter, PPP family, 3-phenylpropionic acid transporter